MLAGVGFPESGMSQRIYCCSLAFNFAERWDHMSGADPEHINAVVSISSWHCFSK
jgi:hypothetical protein